MTAMKVGPVCLLNMTFCFNRVLLVYIFLEPLGTRIWLPDMGIVTKIRFGEVGPIFYFISTFLLESDSCWRLAAKCVSYFSILDSLWTEFRQRATFFAVRIFLATICFRRSYVPPNYSQQNQWSRRALLFLHDDFQCWDVECLYMLVARCVHGRFKSDVHELFCHLHSPCIPLLWLFFLRVYAEWLTKQPSNPSGHSYFRHGGHCRMAFCYNSSTAVSVRRTFHI